MLNRKYGTTGRGTYSTVVSMQRVAKESTTNQQLEGEEGSETIR